MEDVELSTPSDGEILHYDSGKWKNINFASIDTYFDVNEKNTSVSNTTDSYINYVSYNNANNGVAGNYIVPVKFMYKMSSASYYFQYRITINGTIREERKLYVPDSDGVYTFDFDYIVNLYKNQNLNVKIDFKVEQPMWGITTGTIYKSIIKKRPI